MKKSILLIICLNLFLLAGCSKLASLNYFVSDYQGKLVNRDYNGCDQVLLDWCDYVIESNKTINEGRTLKSYKFYSNDMFIKYCEKINCYLDNENKDNEVELFLISSITIIIPDNVNYEGIISTKEVLKKVNDEKTYNTLCKTYDNKLLKEANNIINNKDGSLDGHRFFYDDSFASFLSLLNNLNNTNNENIIYLIEIIDDIKPNTDYDDEINKIKEKYQ